jgi:hypothetical protein
MKHHPKPNSLVLLFNLIAELKPNMKVAEEDELVENRPLAVQRSYELKEKRFICSVHSNQITHKMEFLHQAQANQMAQGIVLPFNKRVSTFVRMHFSTATMIAGKETD